MQVSWIFLKMQRKGNKIDWIAFLVKSIVGMVMADLFLFLKDEFPNHNSETSKAFIDTQVMQANHISHEFYDEKSPNLFFKYSECEISNLLYFCVDWTVGSHLIHDDFQTNSQNSLLDSSRL